MCVNGTIDNSSICSYNGSMFIGQRTAWKHEGSNSLSLTYQIDPLSPLLALALGDPDFKQYISFPNNDAVIIKSATVDPETGILSIELDYTDHLQDKELVLQYTPPDKPQAFLVPEFTSTWIVTSDNQLSVTYYSD